MQTIKPNSAVDDLALTAANFPACVLALRPESVLSGTQCQDIIGGVSLNKSGGGFVNNSNGTFTGGTGAVTSLTGTLPSPLATGKNPMLIIIGTLADAGVVNFGSSVGYGIKTAGGQPITRTPANTHTGPNLTIAGISSGGLLLALNCAANTGAVHAYSGSTYETAATTVAIGTLAGTWDALTQDASLIDAGPYYGIYILHWTTIPSADECKRAIAWMVANPTLGLPPEWYLRT
jgi:hypothetical protein